MWAGVHFRSDVVAGQKIGEGVAEQVIAFAVHRPSGGRDARLRLGAPWGLAQSYRKQVAEAHGGELDCQPSM
ncbi:hypothetical protein CO671_03105 [Rhizobium sp. M10]|nr:hypothetical protein CO671_03105 [Rhizobium sp. M10]